MHDNYRYSVSVCMGINMTIGMAMVIDIKILVYVPVKHIH